MRSNVPNPRASMRKTAFYAQCEKKTLFLLIPSATLYHDLKATCSTTQAHLPVDIESNTPYPNINHWQFPSGRYQQGYVQEGSWCLYLIDKYLASIFLARKSYAYYTFKTLHNILHNGSSSLPSVSRSLFGNCNNTWRLLHTSRFFCRRNCRFFSRVVQYTRTDTTRIMASSFLHDPLDSYDSYRSWSHGLRVLQLVDHISLERLVRVVK